MVTGIEKPDRVTGARDTVPARAVLLAEALALPSCCVKLALVTARLFGT